MIRIGQIATLLALMLPAARARADEPLVGFTYTTDMLPRGKIEVEQWATFREGHSRGDFNLLQTREELSFGVADNFQLSGYVNLAHASVKNDSAAGLTVPPGVFAGYRYDPDRRFEKTALESVSLEGIYRIASPITAPFGAAIYVQPSIGPYLRDLDNRFIVQKNLLDDRLVLAGNLGLQLTWRHILDDPTTASTAVATSDDRHWQHRTTVSLSTAASFRFTSNWNIGAEFRNEREFEGHPFQDFHKLNSTYYAGPSIHYGGEHVFFTLTVLRQLPLASDYTAPARLDAIIGGMANFPSSEEYRFRMKLGYYF